jgi:hypothetical protein
MAGGSIIGGRCVNVFGKLHIAAPLCHPEEL